MTKFVRSLLLVGVVVSAAVSQSGAGGQPAPPFSITIGPASQTVKSSAEVSIKITLTNTSDHEINGSSSYFEGTDASYVQQIRDGSGAPARKGARVSGHAFAGHWVTRHLKPGQSVESVSGLSPEFDLSQPGTYTVQLSRPISDEAGSGVVNSNKITITITV